MFRDKISGIAVAATLGAATLLGANHANAAIDLDAKDKSKSIVFAVELVDKANPISSTDNPGTWYKLRGGAGGALDIKVKLGHRAFKNDLIEVKFELTNMVFGSPNTASTPITTSTKPVNGIDTVLHTDVIAPTADSLSGKKSATFSFTAGRNGTADDEITWSVGNSTAGVFGIAPSGKGSITATVTNLTVGRQGGSAGHTATYENAIDLATALKISSTSNNPMTDVSDGSMSFVPGRFSTKRELEAQVGKIYAGLVDDAVALKNPTDGSNITAVTDILSAAATTVTFEGNFGSFVTGITLDKKPECNSTEEANLETLSKATDSTTKTAAYAFSELDANSLNHHLCLAVSGTAAIPETKAYTAKIAITAANNNITLPASATETLGMIKSGGTTIRLPYLTTNQKYNQRIRIVNRGDGDVTYRMAFHGSGDTAGDDASGMLEAGSIKMLSLRTDDVVTPGNGNNTSATLNIASEPGMIDVATVQINRETGNSDTVVYSAE